MLPASNEVGRMLMALALVPGCFSWQPCNDRIGWRGVSLCLRSVRPKLVVVTLRVSCLRIRNRDLGLGLGETFRPGRAYLQEEEWLGHAFDTVAL